MIMMAAMGCGMQTQMATSIGDAKISAAKIFSIIEENSKIDVRNQDVET